MRSPAHSKSRTLTGLFHDRKGIDPGERLARLVVRNPRAIDERPQILNAAQVATQKLVATAFEQLKGGEQPTLKLSNWDRSMLGHITPQKRAEMLGDAYNQKAREAYRSPDEFDVTSQAHRNAVKGSLIAQFGRHPVALLFSENAVGVTFHSREALMTSLFDVVMKPNTNAQGLSVPVEPGSRPLVVANMSVEAFDLED